MMKEWCKVEVRDGVLEYKSLDDVLSEITVNAKVGDQVGEMSRDLFIYRHPTPKEVAKAASYRDWEPGTFELMTVEDLSEPVSTWADFRNPLKEFLINWAETCVNLTAYRYLIREADVTQYRWRKHGLTVNELGIVTSKDSGFSGSRRFLSNFWMSDILFFIF